MSDINAIILEHEERLRLAMLASDATTLEQLLSDRLIFIDQGGRRLDKEADLEAHRSGLLSLDIVDMEGEPQLRIFGDAAIVWVNTALSGSYAAQPFTGRFAYSRVWHREGPTWRVVAGHCSAITA